MKISIPIAVVIALLGVATTQADMFSPSHSCFKPNRPYEFTSEWELDNFMNDVERYKQCISDFVDEQQEEARNHIEAADEAVEEWNRFVRDELN